MDISIIIGLLIALAIICATITVNNIINTNHRELKKKWENRTIALNAIVVYTSKLGVFIDNLLGSNDLSDETKEDLNSSADWIKEIISTIKSYETKEY